MKKPLEPQVQPAAMRDMADTFTEPLDLRVLEVRALCRIADSLDGIHAELSAANKAHRL